MKTSGRILSFVAVMLIAGCAAPIPPPPAPPKPPTVANDMARAILRHGLTEVEMLKLREAQRQRDDVDLGCLSAEQRAEFKQREQQASTKLVRDSVERMALANQLRTPQAHKERVAAQFALDRCEADLPSNVDKSSGCIDERAERARWGPEPVLQPAVPGQMADSLMRMAKERAVIRADYPACGEAK